MARTGTGFLRVTLNASTAIAALRTITAESGHALDDAGRDAAEQEAPQVKAHGARAGRQAAAVARSVDVRSEGGVPGIQAGGARRVAHGHGPRSGYAGSLLFGSERGSAHLKQFPPPSPSRWFWTTLEHDDADITRAYAKVFDRLLSVWGGVRGH